MYIEMPKEQKYIFEATFEGKPIRTEIANNDTEIDILGTSKYSKPPRVNWLKGKIPIFNWIRNYDRETAIADLIAGITLGMTIIPQSIAYAAVAGISAEYGLYTAFIGSMIYVFIGTIPQASIGPTMIMSLLTLQYCNGKPLQFVFILAFLSGVVEFLMGIFKFGMIISFIPGPVVKAFTSGTDAVIVMVQSKTLFGLKFKSFDNALEALKTISLYDSILGIICCIALLALRQLAFIDFKKQNETTRRLKKALWFVSISRNALVAFISSLITYIWVKKRSMEAIPYDLSPKVPSGLPTITLPPFTFEHANHTYTFTDILSELGSAIIVVPLVGACANVAIAKAFVKDGVMDASQEMLALGLCNIAGSFFKAMPTCGGLTRSAVSEASGVRTPMAGIYTGTIALSVLTPYFEYIPKSTLAAVLTISVLFMIEFKPVKRYWQTNKQDFFCYIGCFIIYISVTFEMGLLTGVIINMLCILIRLGSPKLNKELKEIDGYHYIHVEPQSDVYYSRVDHIRTHIDKICAFYRNDFPVVLDCSRFMLFDATFVDMLNATYKELKESNVLFILQNVNSKLKQNLSDNQNVVYCDDIIHVDLFKPTKQ